MKEGLALGWASTLVGLLLCSTVGAAASLPTYCHRLGERFGLSPMPHLPASTFGDLDADGDLDALIGTGLGRVAFLENTGDASAPAFASPVLDPFGLADVGFNATPAFAAFDADGDLDVLVGSSLGDLFFFENTGSATAPTFGPPQANPFGLTPIPGYPAPALVDVDGDDDFDVLIGATDCTPVSASVTSSRT